MKRDELINVAGSLLLIIIAVYFFSFVNNEEKNDEIKIYFDVSSIDRGPEEGEKNE